MSELNGHVDAETGEILSTSEAALAAGTRAHSAEAAAVYKSENETLNTALHAAVKSLPAWITNDKDNPGFKRDGKALKYASLKTILETVRPKLLEQGIRIRQGSDRSWPADDGAGLKGRLIPVFTELIHAASGEVERTQHEIPLVRLDPQGMGIALTYGRRYTLLSALALATDDETDDDGEGAKLKSMSDGHADSPELAGMTREMTAITSATKLVEWSAEPKQQKRFSSLESDEQAILKQRYTDRATASAEANAESAVEKKPGKRGGA